MDMSPLILGDVLFKIGVIALGFLLGSLGSLLFDDKRTAQAYLIIAATWVVLTIPALVFLPCLICYLSGIEIRWWY